MKMALKKKNKKLNKKKGCGSPQSYSDENNPFCLLGKLKWKSTFKNDIFSLN